ncbi:MAG: histidinol-phosphatase HisJ family protein [Candidatus Thorarchaeota archaeon]|nr:histidinol-phosphatase HisJ family protein [Candidatus Thorarchaeota archaeon]
MMDYHIHPDYSIDAEGSIEEYCNEAVARGIREICFTTHLDLDQNRDDCYVSVDGRRVRSNSSAWFQDYETTIRRAADVFAERNLAVKTGIEVDLYPGVVEDLPEAFHSINFDMIIGSVHLIDHLAISVREEAMQFFKRNKLAELGERYYGLLLDLLDTKMFDILGHLDIYRRYGEEFYGAEVNQLWKPYIEDLVKKMKREGVGFEVNTSSWRRGLPEPMPEEPLVKELVSRGISTVTVGSDSHEPRTIGDGIQRAFDMLLGVGLRHITTFSHRKPNRTRIPR